MGACAHIVLFTAQVDVAPALGQDVQGQRGEDGKADKNFPHEGVRELELR